MLELCVGKESGGGFLGGMVVEIRENFIPDFTNWKDHDAFEATYQRLMKDFKPAPED